MIWKFIDSSINTGSYNMEFDLMLAKSLKPDEPILRLYGWNPYCISLGANQPESSLNIQKIEKQEDIETILEIPNQISLKTSKRICIAFDEFQEIKRIDPFLLNWMRSSFQRHKNISYIFLGIFNKRLSK